MCLHLTPNSRVYTSKKDKTVYKSVYYNYEDDKTSYLTPYYNSIYRLQRTKSVSKFGSYINGVGTVRYSDKRPKKANRVDQGLHCYRTLERAKNGAGTYVLECVIPAGTPYMYGQDNELVTLKLRPVRVAY